MTTFLAGLTLGAAGGAHCVAMCGPFLAAVAPRGRHAAIHHLSRSLVYVALGFAAGVAGAGATAAGLGRWVSWLAAGCLLIQAALPLAAGRATSGSRLVRPLTSLIGRARGLARRHPTAGAFVTGSLNGLLPCGLVYAATVAAVGTGGLTTGVLVMAGFAAGTTAFLATAASLWARLADRLGPGVPRLAPIAIAAVALLLVWRGWAAGLALHAH